ncbi:peptidoglycan-binding protein [Myxococcus sp. AM009]|uniref:peptidoglycan-binding protein n=1 Tax=Myxococcus sp. AM009 TaxID=2745137 RepID=UPI0034D2FC08
MARTPASSSNSNEVRPGSSGPQVQRLKQALKDGGFYDGVVNDQMGAQGVDALKAAKAALKLGGPPDVAGEFTLQKLEEYAKRRGGFDFARELASPDSTLSVAIGNAEGTRTVDGGTTSAYGGHVDPGNAAHNTGTFSYQRGPASSPEDADAKQLANFRSILPRYEAAAREAGLDPNNPLLASAFFDSFNQSEAAGLGWSDSSTGQGLIGQFDWLARNGITKDNLIEARVRSYQNTDGGIEAPGLDLDRNGATTLDEVRADQGRRMDEIVKVLNARGASTTGTAPTGESGYTPAPTSQAPVATPPPAAAGAVALLATGARGPEVSQLQQALNKAGAQPPLAVDGDFGPLTEAAVKQFQARSGLQADGVHGPRTAARLIGGATATLNPATLGNISGGAPSASFEVRPGSRGPEVTQLKQALKDAGFYKGVVNDQMGPDGVAALKAAKEHLKLGGPLDVAGAFTLRKVQEHAKSLASGVVMGNFRVDTENATLRKLATGALTGQGDFTCVASTLVNMERLGVPQPLATGEDTGNNPRGGMVQLVRDFGWKSLPLPGSEVQTIHSPAYGTIQANVISADAYEELALAGQVPSGAIIFQTRHDSWNDNSEGSRGFDMGIVRDGGRETFNYQSNGPLIYGSAQSVVILVPGDALKQQ